MDKTHFFLVVGLTMICVTNKKVFSSVPTSTFLPYTTAKGALLHTFADSTSINVNLDQKFLFLNRTFQKVRFHTDGHVFFGSEGSYTSCANLATGPNIMLYYADADYNYGATLSHFQTTNASVIGEATGKFFAALLTPPKFTFLFAVTWFEVVGYAENTGLRNTYQIVLFTNDKDSYAFLLYNKVQWFKQYATVAIDSGYGKPNSRYTHPSSCRYDGSLKSIANESNINVPGMWAFKVDTKILSGFRCQDIHSQEALQLEQLSFPVTGNLPLVILNSCASRKSNITCEFKDSSHEYTNQTKGMIVENTVTCPTPFLYGLGRVKFIVYESQNLEPPAPIHTGFLHIVPEYIYGNQPQVYINKTMENSLLITAHWKADQFKVNRIVFQNNIEIVIVKFNGKQWTEVGSLTEQFSNRGVYVSFLNKTRLSELLDEIAVMTFAIKGTFNNSNGNESMHKLLISNITLGMDTLFSQVENASMFDSVCHNWYLHERISNHHNVIPCPLTARQARVDWRFTLDQSGFVSIQVNQNISSIFVQRLPSATGESSVCSYNSNGELLLGPEGKTEIQSRSSLSWKNYYDHYLYDVLPYLSCCKWGSNGTQYYQSKRFFNLKSRYRFPKFASAVGQGHITTFNGQNYTFLKSGEYQMITYAGISKDPYTPKFKMNVGVNKVTIGSNMIPAFVVAAMHQSISNEDTTVQVYFSLKLARLKVLLNNQSLDLDSGREQFSFYFKDLSVSFNSINDVIITFATGFAVNIVGVPTVKTINIIALVDQKWNRKLRGLWGNCDDQTENDIVFPNESKLTKSSLTIFKDVEDFALTWKVNNVESIISNVEDFTFSHNDSGRVPWHSSFNASNFLLNFAKHDFCEGVMDCEFDYKVTLNRAYATATRLTTAKFWVILKTGPPSFLRCPQIIETGNMHVGVSENKINSTLEIYCDEGFEIYPGVERVKYICKANDDYEAHWVSSVENIFTFPVCIQKTTTTEVVEEIAHTTLPTTTELYEDSTTSKPESSTTTSLEMVSKENYDSNSIRMLMIGIGVGAGIVVILIVSEVVIGALKRRYRDRGHSAEVNFNMAEPIVRMHFN